MRQFLYPTRLHNAGASYVIALQEGGAVEWPSAWLVVRAIGAGWLILAVWASFGLLLAAFPAGRRLRSAWASSTCS